MAYVCSSSPIPQNGQMPPPASCVDASNAVIELARVVSQNGRTLVYESVPTIPGIAVDSPGAAYSAAIMLPQSELARGSVLTGVVPPPNASTLTVRPSTRRLTVIPLNWRPESGACSPSSAARLPSVSYPVSVPSLPPMLPPSSAANLGQAPATPPGCQFTGFLYRDPVSGKNLPAGNWCNIPVPRVTGGKTGVSGYGPSWGDALVDQSQVGSASPMAAWVRSNPWLVFGALGVAVLAVSAGSKRRGRFG